MYFWFTDYAKHFDYVDHNKLWKILKERGIPDHFTCLLRNLYTGQEATTVRTKYRTMDWLKTGKGLCQNSILSPCSFNLYLTYNLHASCKMPGWMKYKLEIRLPQEISTTSDMQMILLYWQKVKRTKEPLKVERVEWKSCLKLNIQKIKIKASSPTTPWQIDEENVRTLQILFSRTPKSLWMETAATKLKDACSFEENLWPI